MRRLVTLLLFLIIQPMLWAQAAGGVIPAEPKFRVVRSVSGSKGSEQGGRYVIEDPRSTFYLPADKHVIVYFEWDGPMGSHHFEGFWKNSEGKVVVMSDFSYSATTKRFGGYWSLDLGESMSPGMWSLEARVDGEVTGTHTFQIVAAEKPAGIATERPLLSPAEIYKKALAAGVFVEALDATRQRMRTGSGFFLGDGLVVTAFQVIDAATTLRVILPDSRRVETVRVGSYNRLQDWAVLRVESGQTPVLTAAKAKSWSVGDRCFSLQVPTEGNRIIVDESITGAQVFPELGDRFNVSYPPLSPALGSPVMNEYGEVIGVLGGGTQPGAHRDSQGAFTVSGLTEGGMATPIEAVALPKAGMPETTLEELQRNGAFVAPVKRQTELLYGLLGAHFELKKNQLPSSREIKSEFSRSQGTCEVLVVFNPTSKLRGALNMEVYDLNNNVVARSVPAKLKADPGTYLSHKWAFPLAQLKGTQYRVDVLQDGVPVWRAFFRLTD